MNTSSKPSLPYLASCASLIFLILLSLSWELWIAPLRDGGSWLALKALPLCLPLGGILKGRIYTYQYSSMLILIYFAEAVMRLFDASPAETSVRRIVAYLLHNFLCRLPRIYQTHKKEGK